MTSAETQAVVRANNFFWGSATSAYQVEGGNYWSDWAGWEKKMGWTQCGEAVKHYTRFREDFALAKSLGQNAHRFSIEWARLEPTEGNFSQSAIEHYRAVMRELKNLGLLSCVTLHHFTLPQWLADKGGWENPKAVEFFLRYVRLVVKEFGAAVALWITINEPLVLASEGYWYGHWPPFVHSHRRMVRVVKVLAQAHAQAYSIIHEAIPQARVGLAHNFFSLEPYRAWFWLDQIAVNRADKFWNQWLLDLTRGQHDFIGLNYYFHQRAFLSLNPRRGWVGFADPKKLGKETSSLGWEIYPAGIKDVLLVLTERCNLPIYITENGLASLSHNQQISFIIRSLKAVAAALQSGAKVNGYFYWSLLDNFEWDKGFAPKFGLVAVNPQTFARQPKPAAWVYARFCKLNELNLQAVSNIASSVQL
jgi:beta-glucosidase